MSLHSLRAAARVPALYHLEPTPGAMARVIATLASSNERLIVRVTGGCAEMSSSDAKNVMQMFSYAFRGFRGTMLFGGTRMLSRSDPACVMPGITEVCPMIRSENPDSLILGVIALTGEMRFGEHLIIGDADNEDFFTVVHPQQDVVLTANAQSPDKFYQRQRTARLGELASLAQTFPGVVKDRKLCDSKAQPWDIEFLLCTEILEMLHDYSQWKTLLVVFNGGNVTLKEVLDHLSRGWDVLVVAGSGRVADDIAADEHLRRVYKENLFFTQCNPQSFRAALERLSVIPVSHTSGRFSCLRSVS